MNTEESAAIESASDAILRRARILDGTEPAVAELMRELAMGISKALPGRKDRPPTVKLLSALSCGPKTVTELTELAFDSRASHRVRLVQAALYQLARRGKVAANRRGPRARWSLVKPPEAQP